MNDYMSLKNTTVENINWKYIGFTIFIHYIALFLFSLLIGLGFVYVLMSYIQKDQPPADFDVSIPESISPGDDIQVGIKNIYRHKVCPYRRFISVIDSGNKYSGQEVPGYPPVLLGKNPDIYVSFKLDANTSKGPAIFGLTVEYSCPGNFFHAILNQPFVLRKTIPFIVK